MINRLLVANRGEIARRIFRTCADMGIATVAVYEAGDEAHLDYADMGVLVGSYMSVEELIQAAHTAGAQAIHPGYGFLSENAAFARATLDAGLLWIGPPPEAIEAMGSKVEAKKLMAAAGVPTLSDADGSYPLLVKASAGGGGRGMRIVRTPDALEQALAEARSEAEAAFGDPTVFVEPYLEDARHIEVQVLADAHGRVWTLGERECSLQRRHQKVVEESPSPFVTPALREALCAAATRAAHAVHYVNAGTVEFLVDAEGRFYFLEMNTRLQVEHPVTEAVTGLDLVRCQLLIATGTPLPEHPPTPVGHAIEARLYAEDPTNNWLPQSGVLHRFELPAAQLAPTPPPHPRPPTTGSPAWTTTRGPASASGAGSSAWSSAAGSPAWSGAAGSPTWSGSAGARAWSGAAGSPTWSDAAGSPTWSGSAGARAWSGAAGSPTWSGSAGARAWSGAAGSPEWTGAAEAASAARSSDTVASQAHPSGSAMTASPGAAESPVSPAAVGSDARSSDSGTTARPEAAESPVSPAAVGSDARSSDSATSASPEAAGSHMWSRGAGAASAAAAGSSGAVGSPALPAATVPAPAAGSSGEPGSEARAGTAESAPGTATTASPSVWQGAAAGAGSGAVAEARSAGLWAAPGMAGVRVDAGVDSGTRVGVRYDPMLAKVIAYAPTREEAAAKLAAALAGARIHGLRTNRDHLVRTLRHPEFLAGRTTTAFFEQHDLSAQLDDEPFRVAAARAVAALSRTAGWRNVRSQPRRKFGVEYDPQPDDRPDRIVQQINGVRHVFHVAIYDDVVEVDSSLGSVALQKELRFPLRSELQLSKGSLIAPMPGTVVRVGVAEGEKVVAGQPVLWLEAMKMEHQIAAPESGVVVEISVSPGQQVDVGTVLARLEAETDARGEAGERGGVDS